MKRNWFGRDVEDTEIPEALRNMTPQQILDKLNGVDAAAAKQTTLEQQLTDRTEEATRLQGEIAEVRTSLQALEAAGRPQAPQQPNQPVDFFTDPETAMAQRMAPLAAANIQNMAVLNKIQAEQQLFGDPKRGEMNKRIMSKYRPEYEAAISRTPMVSLAHPGSFVAIFNAICGAHIDELAAPENRATFFVEPAGNGVNAEPATKAGPSADDVKYAKALGIDIKEWLENKAQLTYK